MAPQRPIQPQGMQPPSPIVFIPPPGSVQFHGTTYFPVGSPPQPAAYPVTHSHHVAPPPPPPPLPPPPQSSPHYTWYSPTAPSVPSGYSPYSPESLPFQSPYQYRTGLPPVSIAGSLAGPSYDENPMYPGMRPPVSVHDVATTADPDTLEDVASVQKQPGSEQLIEDFPYQPPPPTQRPQGPGHARRISVTLKSKDDSDALGLTTVQGSARPGRESWMGHGQRNAETHRVRSSSVGR